MNLGIIGLGYWGPNIVRNALAVEGIDRVVACDIDQAQLAKINERFPNAETTSDAEGLLADDNIDAIAVVLPVDLHHRFAMKALEAGKHVVLEKPFTSTVAQGEEILELADKKGLVTMVDHTFLYTGAVQKIKQLTDAGELGNIYYYDSARTNLGLFQRDVNVIWDLAPHDFSIMNYVIGRRAKSVRAMGGDHVGRGHVDVAYVYVDFGDNTLAHFNVSWLSPEKLRLTMIGGDKKMIAWDDTNNDEKVRVYDKGFDFKMDGPHPKFNYRDNGYTAPEIEQTEALGLMLQEFSDAIGEGRQGLTSGADGVEVVRILEACDASLKQGGAEIIL